MSFINLKIPGTKAVKLQEEIDCILDYKSPAICKDDTLSLNYKIDISQFAFNIADKLRAIKSIMETDAVTTDLTLDSVNLQNMRECLDLLDSIAFVHRRNQQENITASLTISDQDQK